MKLDWWGNMTHPSDFVEMMVAVIMKGQSVQLISEKPLPWKERFIEAFRNRLSVSSSRKLVQIEPGLKNPGDYLLSEYCSEEIACRYRPTMKKADFLAKEEQLLMNDMLFLIPFFDMETMKAWKDFASDYAKALPKERRGCLFLIESREDREKRKGVIQLVYEDYVGSYDFYLFNLMLSSSMKAHPLYRQYFAEVLTLLFKDNIEISEKLMFSCPDFLKEPQSHLSFLKDEYSLLEGRIYLQRLKEEDIKDAFWEAQIRVFFPLIEKERKQFISDYAEVFRAYLPFKRKSGELVESLEELEIGEIFYLMKENNLPLKPEIKKRIALLREARNFLAHLNLLTEENIKKLIAEEKV